MMNRRTAIAAFASLFSFLAPLAGHAQASAKHRVVFQVSDSDPTKWNLALNNARNVQADLGKDEVEIEIVAYGPGLAMLKAHLMKRQKVGLTSVLEAEPGPICRKLLVLQAFHAPGWTT